MYRLFGNAPVGRSDETQMSADWMAIENRKKAREKFEKHQKRRKAPNHESACRRKGRSQRQKMEPGAMHGPARIPIVQSRSTLRSAVSRGVWNGGKLRKAAVESSSGKRQWNGLFQSSAPPQIRPVAEILGRGEQVAGCVHQFRSLRARPLLNGRRVAAGRSRRSGTVGNIR